eukprot:scaffold3939_cov166-Amphora_coffeaeformis.AAC.10
MQISPFTQVRDDGLLGFKAGCSGLADIPGSKEANKPGPLAAVLGASIAVARVSNSCGESDPETLFGSGFVALSC